MKNRLVKIFFVVCVSLLMQGCGAGNQECNPVKFPYVEVPSYIIDREQAVNYLARNFWDNFFAIGTPCTREPSTVHGVDSISFEESFGSYAGVLTAADSKSVAASADMLFRNLDSLAMKGEKKPLLTVMELAERYFYNPNSPVLDEEIYLQMLNGILAAGSLTETDKMQYEYQYRICSMNREGTPAADFKFRQFLSDGKYADKTLYNGIGSEFTLLFFNNPDCNSCADILETLKQPAVQQMVQSGTLSVLAMYIDEDLTAWRKNRSKYPYNWIYAYDPELVLRDNNIYGLRAIPSLYLLNKEKRVLLKDAPADEVILFLQSL